MPYHTRVERVQDLINRSIPGALKAWGLQLPGESDWRKDFDKAVAALAKEITILEFAGAPRDPLTETQVEIAIAFWTRAFEVADKVEAFEAALRKYFTVEFDQFGLEVDYDPKGPLLDAIRETGIECRGCMFSAEGILPLKSRTTFDQFTGGVMIKLEYANDIGTAYQVSDLDGMLRGYRIGPNKNTEENGR